MTIAEESTAWPGVTRPTHLGGLGFGFKWNMGWMHDTLDYISHEPVHRQYHHNEMTFSMMYAYTENFVLPISHDEVVHGKGSLLGKMPGDRWQQMATLRAFLAYMWAHPGKQLLFMGREFGQGAEWAESRSLDWWLLDLPDHRGVHSLVGDLNAAYSRTRRCGRRSQCRRLRLDRRQRRRGQRAVLPAVGTGRLSRGLRGELLAVHRTTLPARPAASRDLGRGGQHRRRRLHRFRRRQLRLGRSPRRHRGTASRRRRRWCCRRSARSGSPPPPNSNLSGRSRSALGRAP